MMARADGCVQRLALRVAVRARALLLALGRGVSSSASEGTARGHDQIHALCKFYCLNTNQWAIVRLVKVVWSGSVRQTFLFSPNQVLTHAARAAAGASGGRARRARRALVRVIPVRARVCQAILKHGKEFNILYYLIVLYCQENKLLFYY